MGPSASTCGGWPSETPQQDSKLYRSVHLAVDREACAAPKADSKYTGLTLGK